MPDFMDNEQQRQLAEADAIAALPPRTPPASAGRTHCQRHDCGEPIAVARTALGAVLCIDCQRERDAQAAHFSQWRR